MTMQIRIKCFATLSDHTPEGGILELPAGATVMDTMTRVGLKEADVKLIFVNSKSAGLDTVLADDDQLGIFPAVGGG
jgi:molybdopterin converting factor small subunit